ncbi:MAG: PepSY-associated TM helix domain-containing protein [Xanthomonadales bacterium]|nr:PepSY-associated TM helix domain-containing protein [Xanthomonadales bacterium]
MNRKKRRVSKARRLHRSFGAGAAIFVLFMVLSGLAINHSNGLGLDQRHVSQSFLLDWYGLGKPERIDSFAVGDDWLSFAGSQLFLNEKSVATISGGVGAVSSGELLIAAGNDELLLLDHDGNLIERIPWGSIGAASIELIGLHESTVVSVKSAGQLWLADTQLLNWRQAGDASPDPLWANSEFAPDGLQQAITESYRGEGPSLERLLLDLHSGRIFGTIGVLVYDLLALALGFLSISGLVLWFRSRRNGKPK